MQFLLGGCALPQPLRLVLLLHLLLAVLLELLVVPQLPAAAARPAAPRVVHSPALVRAAATAIDVNAPEVVEPSAVQTVRCPARPPEACESRPRPRGSGAWCDAGRATDAFVRSDLRVDHPRGRPSGREQNCQPRRPGDDVHRPARIYVGLDAGVQGRRGRHRSVELSIMSFAAVC